MAAIVAILANVVKLGAVSFLQSFLGNFAKVLVGGLTNILTTSFA